MVMIRTTFFILFFLLTGFRSFVYSQVDQDQIYKFNQVIDNISSNYVDSVDISVIVESAIKASLKELDPHSVYYPKEKVEEINRGLVGSYTGIGISYDIIQDTVMVLSVAPGGPSETAGILPGDRIIQVEDEIIAGTKITDEKLKELLQGERGTTVTVRIKRRNLKRLKFFQIERAVIPISSIEAAYTDGDVAYIKLNRFSSTTIEDFKKTTDTLLTRETNKLILDLRNNSGGYLYVSVKLLEFFLERNKEVLTTKGVHSPEKKYYTQITGKYPRIKLIVLINEHSASASEILAGAVQDWDRGIIVGRRSFGKGLVQKPIYLVDGSMLRLTIAKYYTPSGRNIQKPYDKGTDEYRDEVENRLISGELIHKDSIKYVDSLKYYTLNNNRVIYGGGGIMPDVFVPVDTLKFPVEIREKVNKGKFNEFIHIYTDKRRDEFTDEFRNFEDFENDYTVNYNDIQELINYLFSEEDQNNELIQMISKNEYLLSYTKALIANDLYGENEYYQIFNSQDETYLKAIELMNDDKKYSGILHDGEVSDRDAVVKTPE